MEGRGAEACDGGTGRGVLKTAFVWAERGCRAERLSEAPPGRPDVTRRSAPHGCPSVFSVPLWFLPAVAPRWDDPRVSATPTPDDRRRLRRMLLGTIAVLLVVLVLVLMWALDRGNPDHGDGTPEADPLPGDASRYVRVQGADGQIVPGTEVDVRRDPNKPIDVTWHPPHGVLVLPEGGGEYPVRVVMPGHRVSHYPAVRGGQLIRVRPGYVVKVPLRGIPEDGLPKHVRFLLRVQPKGDLVPGFEPQEVVDLMANRGGPNSGPQYIPRGQFGYPLSREQAAAGIVLPAIGTYHIRWGLIDIKESTWQGLGETAGRDFEVKDSDDVQEAPLDVTVEHLQQTLDDLAKGVEAAKKHKADAQGK